VFIGVDAYVMAGTAVLTPLRRQRPVISLVDADPDMARRLGPSAQEARRDAVAAVRTLKRGPWRPEAQADAMRGWLGLMILDGFVLREVRVAGRVCSEPLGPGDIVRPWDEDIDDAPVVARSTWTVLSPVRLALLDGDFARRVRPWPQVSEELVYRAVRRSRTLGAMLAISHLVRIEDRVQTALWHLAERWGQRQPDGLLVPLHLTHRSLGALIGARRPSVTTALGALARQGVVTRAPDGWLLHGGPPPSP
jgi:CRP/FNR family cyclic AMP-dependent transcriptional regulator